MKLLWLCNMPPSAVQEQISGTAAGGLWVDHVLAGLRTQDMTIRILSPGGRAEGTLDERCSYRTFREGAPYVYLPELEKWFLEELKGYQPDVIHIWGTEYGHTLALVKAAKQLNLLDRVVVSIQGLCSVIAKHYAEGVPYWTQKLPTFRDFLRQDTIAQQQDKFLLRGVLEVETLKTVHHVIGRTHWDRACALQINPGLQYHLCNETLREPFYEDHWSYERCSKHTVFAASHSYPVKGFHYAIQAFAEVCAEYPDARLMVTGKSFFPRSFREKLRQNGYQRYLAKLADRCGIADRITFLGGLSPEKMKQAFLDANVFILPSTIENSPNALGEAMLLGVPCVANDVGGVMTLMDHGTEGYVCPSTAPYMMAHYIKTIFAREAQAATLGDAARKHARCIHDPEKNLRDLLAIYNKISG